MEFTLTEDHLKLLSKMWVGWSPYEFGAPEIDPKRPYGNSYVVGDIHEILTGVSDYEVPDELSTKYEKLHKETETALQIVLCTQQFKAGRYRKTNPYGNKWEEIPQNYYFAVDENFYNALSDLADKIQKSKEEVIRDALNYYEKAVDSFYTKNEKV